MRIVCWLVLGVFQGGLRFSLPALCFPSVILDTDGVATMIVSSVAALEATRTGFGPGPVVDAVAVVADDATVRHSVDFHSSCWQPRIATFH